MRGFRLIMHKMISTSQPLPYNVAINTVIWRSYAMPDCVLGQLLSPGATLRSVHPIWVFPVPESVSAISQKVLRWLPERVPLADAYIADHIRHIASVTHAGTPLFIRQMMRGTAQNQTLFDWQQLIKDTVLKDMPIPDRNHVRPPVPQTEAIDYNRPAVLFSKVLRMRSLYFPAPFWDPERQRFCLHLVDVLTTVVPW